jgi:cystathionine beta-lyase/cystathionine gamma-synthase
MKFSTRAIHAGGEPDPATGAIMPPIYMTSTYLQDAPGETRGYAYTRAGNPNFTILEKTLASLEGAEYATVFSSGIGALTALIGTLSQGDRVVALESIYGGTYRLFDAVFRRFGIIFETVSLTSLEVLDKALASRPKWLLFETPTNPVLELFDIEACVKIARRYGVNTIVDNTFATPYFQSPLKWGVDLVWHSTTKYISGHSDVIGGAIMTNSATFKNQLDFTRKAMGLNPSPFDCWLINRGVKTLALRMQRHEENALAIVKYLSQQPKVLRLYYPGLTSHPGHAIAKKQMSGFGGMISAEFNLSLESTKKLISSFALFSLAESLGGVESLVCHPVTMTHAAIPAAERARCGIQDGLVRFSIGIEDVQDLIDDLEQGLECI